MFIASKIEEVFPIRLKILQEKIAHNKLTMEQIKYKELEIVDTLKYNLIITHPLNIIDLVLAKININNFIKEEL